MYLLSESIGELRKKLESNVIEREENKNKDQKKKNT